MRKDLINLNRTESLRDRERKGNQSKAIRAREKYPIEKLIRPFAKDF